jgi:hypothetical protein
LAQLRRHAAGSARVRGKLPLQASVHR